MKTKLVQIGNSRGVRIPKSIIEQAGLSDDVELRLAGSQIVIESVSQPRAGWAEDARELHARGEDKLLDPISPTDFDESDWEW